MQPPRATASTAARPAASGVLFIRSPPPGRAAGLAGDRTILSLVGCSQRADELSHVFETLGTQIVGDPLVDALAHHGVVEQRRAHPDCGGAGDDELERVVGAGDAALADDRDAVRAGDL